MIFYRCWEATFLFEGNFNQWTEYSYWFYLANILGSYLFWNSLRKRTCNYWNDYLEKTQRYHWKASSRSGSFLPRKHESQSLDSSLSASLQFYLKANWSIRRYSNWKSSLRFSFPEHHPDQEPTFAQTLCGIFTIE